MRRKLNCFEYSKRPLLRPFRLKWLKDACEIIQDIVRGAGYIGL